MTAITSRKNHIIQKYRKLIREKKERFLSGSFVLEGYKLSVEALECGFVPKSALFTAEAMEKHSDFYKAVVNICGITVISADLGEYISDTKTPQGIFIELPLIDKSKNPDKIILNAKRIILLDGLQDTGNMGTIIRTADAFGMDAVVYSPDCPDIHSGKVIRGSMGSVFRVDLICCGLRDIIKLLKQNDFFIYASILDRDAERLGKARFADKSAIVIGSEGSGISPEIRALADKIIYIPIENAQSLNAGVAAAILMWEMTKS
ncbi:MAG: RNA methyltransferase [Eubacterium sp.]|jgi:TrmH family RNA methyltransferase|nr:RNA methyltransferase [Eubacterium sp.]